MTRCTFCNPTLYDGNNSLTLLLLRSIALEGTTDIGIKTTGLGVFMQSIKYRYYPIYMLVLVFVLICSQRDYGNMLIAERKTRVYKRTDGGDGKGKVSQNANEKQNQPNEGTPLHWINLVLPVLLLIALVFYLLVQTGEIPGTDQTFMEKIENSDSYSALLWSTFGTALITLLFFLFQIVQDGRFVDPR